MRRRIFEDSQIPDTQRQVAGVGSEVANKQDNISLNDIVNKQKDPHMAPGLKPYPLGPLDELLASTFINLVNIRKLIQVAAENPVLKDKIGDLKKYDIELQKINKVLVDLNDKVDTIII